jgi:hypothetical protein
MARNAKPNATGTIRSRKTRLIGGIRKIQSIRKIQTGADVNSTALLSHTPDSSGRVKH